MAQPRCISSSAAQAPDRPSVREVVFTIDPEDIQNLSCELFARAIAAEDGKPLAGHAFLSKDPFPRSNGTEIADDGRVHLAGELPGKCWLILQVAGRAQVLKQVTLSQGQTLDLGDLELHLPIEIAGHVLTESGEPIEAVLRWGRLDPATQEVRWARTVAAQSRPDGSFTLGGLEPGLWVVRAHGLPARGAQAYDQKLSSLSIRADSRQGSVSDLELVLHETTVITFVTEKTAEPWPTVSIYDERGVRAASTSLGRSSEERQVHLPPGSYELIFMRDGAETERRKLVVDGEPQRIEVSFD